MLRYYIWTAFLPRIGLRMMINMKVRLKSCFKFENGRLAIKLILNAAQANKGEFTADHSKCLEALKFNVRLLSNARVPFMIPMITGFLP